MKKQFCSYEISLKLKKLGFNEFCLAIYRNSFNDFGITLISDGIKINGTQSQTLYYNSNINMICLAPLYQQTIDWLREKYNLHIEIQSPQRELDFYSWTIRQPIKLDSDEFNCRIYEDGFTNNYYKSREQAILKAIELCQNKK